MQQEQLEKLAAALPSCALECMKVSLPQSSCTLTDQKCQCTDVNYTATLERCVATTCTIRQSLTTKNVTSSACGAPLRDRTALVSYLGVGGGVLALIAFILRMVARLRCCGGTFGMDDWTMMLTMSLVIPLSALSVVLADAGLGKDMWTIPLDNVTRILYIYFWDELIYLSILPLTKISICCFYLRIFPDRRLRTATYIVIGLNGWAAAIINMVLDILVMVLPLRQLYNLNLSTRKKAYVMCMFSLGIFVTLVSILRLNSLIHFASTTNLTWDYVSVGYWSTVEVDVGVICACLPAIRSLLRRVSPGLFGDTEKAKSYGMNSRSPGTGSRFEGGSHVQSKNEDRQFYPLDDIDTSSETRLHH
ncbi:hypothetical protein PENANT_c022G09635 [Penicillium antarcticum]|uniref:CFEM domain-containing protein n=1 Tax=Penicillium antarcticum TaxID=416450 RepID=A0A1V6PZC2_9EURO|nr:hypothetical protein PENANT_c022G09635 [Penicillium antarcticum]